MFNRTKSTRRRMIVVAALFVLTAVVFAAWPREAAVVIDNDPVGLMQTSYLDESRDRQLDAYIWYPTNDTDEVVLVDENAVFHGFTAIMTATTMTEQHPLVVFSHGSGGNRANQGWLATELAREGAIVVAANHPGSTSMDSAPETNILTWNRPEDISFLIDSILADPQFGPLIDPERIAVVGHSLGGYTVLAAGGAELSLDQFIAYCDELPDTPDCTFYREGGVDLTQVDRSRFEQANRDERIKAVVAIDPAYARSFTADSLQNMTDVLLIAAGAEGGFESDIEVTSLAAELDLGDNYVELAEAHHFTFLPECKPIGYYVLMVFEKDGELLCWPEEGQTRTELQATTVEEIEQFLQQQEILK